MNRRKRIKISNRAFIGGIASALFVCLIFISISYVQYEREKKTVVPVVATQPIRRDYFAKDVIEAKAAIVYDVSTHKIIYQKNADKAMPLASITKVMTALVANQILSKDQTVAIDQSSLDVEGESGFKLNQPWKLSDLLNFTLLISSNDGAHAIANTAAAVDGINFPQKMDNTAKQLGLDSMQFNNESGLDLDNSDLSGGYGSAADVAKLFSHILSTDPGLLEITKNDSWNFRALDNTLYPATNTDLIVDRIPGLLASKTGYTDLAGGNLAVAFDTGLNHPVVIVVLGSSWDGRFTDVLTLASSTIQSL